MGRVKMPKPTRFEKALARVAPGAALKRYKNRASLAVAQAYTGASKKRRSMSAWNTPSGDFNTDVLPELQELRERSEDLFRNNMLAAGVINTKVTSIVGSGLKVHPRVDAEFLGLTDKQADAWEATAKRYVDLYFGSKFCTINKKYNFYEYQGAALISSLVRGDSFTLTPEKESSKNFPFRLRLQLVEADRVCNKDNAPDSSTLAGGIETDTDGALKNLHVMRGFPGSPHNTEMKWDVIHFYGEKTGRRNVLPLYETVRADQSRGVPDLAPVIEGLKQFSTLTQATIDAAVIQTFLSVFIKTADGTGLDLPADSSGAADSMKLESAAIIDLAEGEEPFVVNPTHPNSNYSIFANEFYTQIGAALQIPREVLIKYFGASYSASQAALLEAWRYFMARRARLVDNICQPVYELVISGLISDGLLPAPGFFVNPLVRAAYLGADWVGPPRGHIRDDVQNKADGYAEDRGWKTAAQNTQERGGTFERNHRQRVKEVTMRRDAGLITTSENEGVEDIVKVDE